uniref:Alternative protein CXCL9 n=1 Tax=Homo sapiens TaxID=9606 RepID=L8E8X0_HUMAN|nr:alternative protein CXCL9 [Homo sapiens]
MMQHPCLFMTGCLLSFSNNKKHVVKHLRIFWTVFKKYTVYRKSYNLTMKRTL